MLHSTTQNYLRNMLNARLRELTEELISAPAVTLEDAARVNDLMNEIRTVTTSIADLLTHHLDAAKAEPAPETEEVREARKLHTNIMRSASAIRDLEVALGMSDKNGTRAHNLMRDMRVYVEKQQNKPTVNTPVNPHANGRDAHA